jgi:D-methionine transport system substrate-binding protein
MQGMFGFAPRKAEPLVPQASSARSQGIKRRTLLAGGAVAMASGCKRKPASDTKTLKFIMSDIGFNAELEPIISAELAKRGFSLDWVVVNDIILPNEMVDSGQADANAFQHQPYFDQFVKDHDLHNIVRGFYTTYTPSGLYSKKYKSITDVPNGALFAIPVDPANNGRALFMLRDRGLLSLRPGVEVTHASLRDITANPHQFRFVQVDQMMLQRTYQDVDVAFMFSLFAKQAGLDPLHDAVALESLAGETTPYKGLVAIRKDLVGSPKIRALQAVYASPELKAFYRRKYGDAIVFLDGLNH